ncbi:hypothetical protein [Streptomyces griseoaurantiacus]|uniref:hypothetical protein n=1 Tax=Streptomyces griseoaurantiacus TaxID=68213 RepID=UPI00368720FA
MGKRLTLADIVTVTETTYEIGRDKIVLPVVEFRAWDSGKRFAQVRGTYAEVCGRCGGEGRVPEAVHNGVCFDCNWTGLHGDTYDSREELDSAMRTWGMNRRRAERAAARRAEKARAEREAAEKVWQAEQGALIEWCRSLTPDSTEKVDMGWGPFQRDYFDTYGRAAMLITRVREGEVLDAREAGLITSVMHRVTAAQTTARYAGEVDEKVTVTGVIKVYKPSTAQYGYRTTTNVFMIVEGTGADAGVTLKLSTAAAAAFDVDRGDTITVTGTVKAREERGGIPQTKIARPKITPADPEPQQPQQSAPAPAEQPQEPTAEQSAPEPQTAADDCTRCDGGELAHTLGHDPLGHRTAAALAEHGVTTAADIHTRGRVWILDSTRVGTKGFLRITERIADIPDNGADTPQEGTTTNDSTAQDRADTAANLAACFTPQDAADETTRPCLVVDGVQVYAYRKDGRLVVSLDLDTAQTTREDGTVPMVITVAGREVFTG